MAPCGCGLLADADTLPEDVRDDARRRAVEAQRAWGCDRGRDTAGAPEALQRQVAHACGRLLGDPELFEGCPSRGLYDADVHRVCRYRRYLAEPGGAAALAVVEPDPPAVLFDALDAVMEGEALAHRWWKERLDAKTRRPPEAGADMPPGRVRRHG